MNREDVISDFDSALHWLLKAAQPGNEFDDAQYQLGVMYEKGHGVGVDYDVALEWYEKAVSQGHEYAQKAYENLSDIISNSGRSGKYSTSEIIEMVHEALDNPATVYNQGFTKYKGIVRGQRYTEIVARELSLNIEKLKKIPVIERKRSYKIPDHEELAERSKPPESNRDEEWFAVGMYGNTYQHIGEVIDFQTPLQAVETDNIGAIDVLSYNKDENIVYILELKKIDNPETLLRCVLEVYTYWKTVHEDNLLRDFGKEGAQLRKAVLLFNNCPEYEAYLESGSSELFDISEAVMKSDSCLAYKDFHDDKCGNVRSLMTDKLGVDLFILSADGKKIIDAYRHDSVKE